MYRRPVQFRVLGPLEVDAGDGPIPLGGRKQRAVLASLLVRANQVVSTDALIEDVWGDEAPETARNILQTYVANLRKALRDDRLQGRPPGYILTVDTSELDAAHFDALVAAAKKSLPVDPNVAIATFEDALSLWRGPALADLHEHSSLLAEAARLDELRLDAQEDRIEGLLATGAPAKALSELEPLLAAQPLRESLWGLAMLAFYRAGRQADALNAYGRARELLADELGIDPSPELARLHERILKQDPSLELRGEPLRGYRLLEKIGVGSHGTVFRGIQPHVRRDVAVKVFDERIATDPSFLERFELDAQVVASLEHPHIVPTYDYWREPGRAYLVTRYMRGGSLRALRERAGTLESEHALRIVAEVASALGFAHRQGVAHGGIRDSNVLLDAEGHAYLTDFPVGRAPANVEQDLVDLRSLSRDLLPNAVPTALARTLVDPDGTTAPEAAMAIAEAAQGMIDGPDPEVARRREERNPYKGLRAFGEADAHDFFGRAGLTERLIRRLREPDPAARFLAIVGPSGGGKSSAVRAALVPAIRRGALGDRRVLVADMFPGSHPLDELEASLMRVSSRTHARMGDLLAAGTRGLLEAVELVTSEDTELVLVIDQFEELFTLTTEEHERDHFLDCLRVATVDPASRVRVIVTLRADFYDRPLVYPRFGELLAIRNETLPPLTPDELEQAIRRPAEEQGMRLESGLVAEMIADVAHEPGGLPLLQYALTELFERRDGDRLTLSAYEEIGGVTGALSARADRLYANADDAGKRASEQVFLRLVTLGEGRQDTRRRVALGELEALDVPDAAVEGVLDAFGRHRLLTFDREPSTREPTVEIAHEALLRAWGRLAAWIDHAREDLRQNDRLTRAAAEWRGSEKDPSFLMSGARLDQVEAWSGATTLSIGQSERAYVKASLDQRDRVRQAEQARREREAAIERRSVRRLRALVAVFAVAALVAGSLTVIATNQGGRAEHEARVALARELAAASVSSLTADPERAILLALEAVRTTRSVDGTVLLEAEEALHRAVDASRIESSVPALGQPIAWSSSGVFAAQQVKQPGMIEVRDAASLQLLYTLRADDDVVKDVAFSADGRFLASTGPDGVLSIWDAASGDALSTLKGDGPVVGLSFAPGMSLLSASWPREGRVRIVDPADGHIRQTLRRVATETSLSPEGDHIALVIERVRDKVGVCHVIDLGTLGERFEPLASSTSTPTTYGVSDVAWSPDGSLIATVSASAVDFWDAATGDLRSTKSGGFGDLAWSSDSSRLVNGGSPVRVWDVADKWVEELSLASLGITQGSRVAISPDGMEVMATADDTDSLSVWDIGVQGNAEWANLPARHYFGNVVFLPDGSIMSVDPTGALTVWDPRSGQAIRTLGPPGIREHRLSLSANGRSVAITDYFYRLSAWDVASGRRLFGTHTADSPQTSAIEVFESGWSPDGELLAMSFYHDGGGTPTRPAGTTTVDRDGVEVDEFSLGQDSYVPRFSPDGALLAVSVCRSEGAGVDVWDVRRHLLVATIPAQCDSPLAFAARGDRIALIGEDGTPELWDLASRSMVSDMQAGRACSIALNPDGSRVAVGGGDGVIRVFKAETGEQTLALQGHENRDICGVAFSPDGTMLASHGLGMVRVWALDIDDLIEIARGEVTRSLTDDECRQYLHVEACAA